MYGGVTGKAGDRLPMSIIKNTDFAKDKFLKWDNGNRHLYDITGLIKEALPVFKWVI
jgi:hypothetical protein